LASQATTWNSLPALHSAATRTHIDWWRRWTVFMVIGYFAMGRSFAYFGIPPLKLFIGEIVLFAFLLIHPRAGLDRIRRALTRPSLLSDYSWALVLLLLYGVVEIFRGAYAGYSVMNAIQSFVFNYYPLYLLLGIWMGERDRGFLRRVIIACAWVSGIYGVLYIGYLSRIQIFIPGSQGAAVTVFGQPWGSMVALLGLTSLGFDFRRTWFLLVLNTAVLLGMQVRAEWVGCIVGLVVYSFLTQRFDKLIGAFAVAGLLLTIALAADLRLPGAASRGGSISTRDIVGRALAPVNQELAAELTPNARSNAGTFEWRTTWWKAIWKDNHKDALTAAIGEGYGYPLVDLVDYLKGRTFLRTPHNMFFFALGYGGWLLVSIFALLQVFILRLLLRAWRMTGNPFGVSFWAAVVVWSLFGDSFETPYGAIPFFIIAGACIAPLFRPRLIHANPVSA
jgi:hypothetical protein